VFLKWGPEIAQFNARFTVNGLAQSGVGKSRKCCFPHGAHHIAKHAIVFDHLANFTPPKRRFWTSEPTFPNVFPGEALFKGVSTRFGLRIVENCFEHTFGKVGLDFPNIRLGSINLLQKMIASTENQRIASYAIVL
jgi:hypothetical protein